MIATEQAVAIAAPIGKVWDFASRIPRWANLMPGLVDFELMGADESRWTLKVGAGALVRTVKVLVEVNQWAGPEAVDFSFRLESDPVDGGGSYRAKPLGPDATEVALAVQVEGRGPMAPMWEAMGKPLLPAFAKAFAEQLKGEIELAYPPAAASAAAAGAAQRPRSLLVRLLSWLMRFLRRTKGRTMSEANKATVRTFIEAFSRGDAATAETCLAADAQTVAKGFGRLSGVRPREIVLATTASFKQLIPTGLRPRFVSMTAEGDRVAAEFEGNSTLANGEKYDNQYCMVFTLRDGKIVNVNEYYCTILADAKILPLLAEVEQQRKALGQDTE